MRKTILTIAALLAWSTCALAATPGEILDANHAATGGDAWNGKPAIEVSYAYSGQGLTGEAHGTTDLHNGWFTQFATIGPRKFARGFNGEHSWIEDSAGLVTLNDGADSLALSLNAAYRNANLWWQPDRGGAAITDAGQQTVDGNTYDVLKIVPKGGEEFEAWFDPKTHLLARTREYYAETMNATIFSDYRSYNGALIPASLTLSTGNPVYDQHFTLTKLTLLTASDAKAYAPPQSQVHDVSFADNKHQTTISFDLVNNHTHADVMINGKGPFYFLYDTGAQNILSPEVAKAVGLTPEGRSEMRGTGEGALDTGVTKVHAVQFGDVTLHDQVFAVLPMKQLFASNGVQIQGMIGSETFKRFVTRVDYGAHRFTFMDPKNFGPKDAGIPVKVAFNYNEVVADGSFDGIPGKFQIDSGSRNTLTLNVPFATANNLRARYVHGSNVVDGWGLGGPSHGYAVRGGDLKVGDAEVKNIVFAIGTDKGGSTADASMAGLIGGGFLKRYIVTFDYGHGIMYLKPIVPPVADLDTYDRSGMWINAEPEGYKIVAVNPGGAAEATGLKEGDIITDIDGKPVLGDALPATRTRFRNDPAGTVVTLSVMRGSDARTVTLTLRDQV